MNEHDLAQLLREHASRHSVPGAAIGILRDGEVTAAYHGVGNVTTGQPVTPEIRFSVGSLTKSMVATVVARLHDAGRLSLDDPVAARVPEVQAKAWAERATLRDLLANRSGLPLLSATEFGLGDRDDADDALSRLARDLPAAPAGGFWSYTNVGWCLLGRAIETATNAVWQDAMRRYLLGDAGLLDTEIMTSARRPRCVSGHAITPDGPVPVPALVSRAYAPAGTSIVSTVGDLLQFARLHLDDPALARLRLSQSETAIHGWLDAWCLGWARFDWDGGPVWGWDGLIDGERSVLRIIPEQRAAVVLLTNSDTGRAMYRSLFTELMASLFGIRVTPLRLEASPALDDLRPYAGVYAWPDRRVVVAATASHLVMTRGGQAAEMLPLGEGVFLTDAADPDNPTVTFGAFDDAGRPRVLYLMLWGLARALD